MADLNKRTRFREMLSRPEPTVLVGAHDALSAQMVENYGFDAVWVSGFGISTMQFAVPDLNLITMTETLQAAERMHRVSRLPVIADCDNGFGSENNLLRTVREFEASGIAGICVEDNVYPKVNSLYCGQAKRALIPMDEQAQRIRAAKKMQVTDDFTFIARIESLIAGHGVDDAISRAKAYIDAGADVILIHSKDKTLGEINGFLEQWDFDIPLIAIPTLYPEFSAQELHEKGFQGIIFANQLMRASVKGMEETLATLEKTRRLSTVEESISPVNHIFELVRTEAHLEKDTESTDNKSSEANKPSQLIQAFERSVNAHENRIALKVGDTEVSYKALNENANAVANYLLSQNNCDRVALYLDQPIETITSLLGTLKAGKIYVPLDPQHPDKRIEFILNDSQADLIITNARLNEKVKQASNQSDTIKNLDELVSLNSQDPIFSMADDHLASIIYTSGSTGSPKGVLQNHKNIYHKATEYIRSLSTSSDDNIVLLYSTSTSGATRDIFSALLSGATLHPFDLKTNGFEGLQALIIKENITIYNSVASVFRHFMQTVPSEITFPSLRNIQVGSEMVYQSDVDYYRSKTGDDCAFVVNFGSTEISPIRKWSLNKDTTIESEVLPVGKAIDEVRVVILDENRKPVQSGEVGEIAIQSPYVTPGYWARDDLNASAFVDDPESPGQSLFLSGDIGRLNPDGSLSHLGRKDFQVKIRGFRVELEEIEAIMNKHPDVKDSLVVSSTEQRDVHLHAYCQKQVSSDLSEETLRNHLSIHLPDYMLPHKILFVADLPTTPSGKKDRNNPPPIQMEIPFGDKKSPPDSKHEKHIAQCWADLLNEQEICLEDNFFHLGGDSIKAMRLTNKINSDLDLSLNFVTVFEYPTLGELSVYIQKSLDADEE